MPQLYIVQCNKSIYKYHDYRPMLPWTDINKRTSLINTINATIRLTEVLKRLSKYCKKNSGVKFL